MLQSSCKIDIQTLASFSRTLTTRLSGTNYLLLLECIISTTKTYQETLRSSLKITTTATTMSIFSLQMIWNTLYQLQLTNKLWTFRLILTLLIYEFFQLISSEQNKRITRFMIHFYSISSRLRSMKSESLYDDEFQNASENVCIDVVTVETLIVQNQIIQLAAKLSSQILNHISFSDQSSYASCIFVLSFKLTKCKKSLILILKVSILFNQINRTSSLTMSKVVSLHQSSSQFSSIKLLIHSI